MKPKTYLPLSLRNMRNERDQREREWNALQRSRGPEPIIANEIVGDFPATSDPATSLYRQFLHDLNQKFEEDMLSVDAFKKYKLQIESLYEAKLLKPKHFENLMNLLHTILYRQFSHDLIQKFEDKDKLSMDAFKEYKSQIESLYEAELLKPKQFDGLMNLLHKVYQFPRLRDQVAINKKSNKPVNYGGNRSRKTRRQSSRRKTYRKRRVTRKTRRRSSRRRLTRRKKRRRQSSRRETAKQ